MATDKERMLMLCLVCSIYVLYVTRCRNPSHV